MKYLSVTKNSKIWMWGNMEQEKGYENCNTESREEIYFYRRARKLLQQQYYYSDSFCEELMIWQSNKYKRGVSKLIIPLFSHYKMKLKF